MTPGHHKTRENTDAITEMSKETSTQRKISITDHEMIIESKEVFCDKISQTLFLICWNKAVLQRFFSYLSY